METLLLEWILNPAGQLKVCVNRVAKILTQQLEKKNFPPISAWGIPIDELYLAPSI